MTGTAIFTQLIDYIGGRSVASGGFTEIDTIESVFEINFGTGAIDITKFDVCFAGEGACGSQNWSVTTGAGLSLSSTAGKGLLEETVVSGTTTSSSSTPETGAFTGFINGFSPSSDDGDIGFVFGFNFNASFSTDPDEEVIGADLFLGESPLGVTSGQFTKKGMLFTGSSENVASNIFAGPVIPNASGMSVIAARSSNNSSTYSTPFDTSSDYLLRLASGSAVGFRDADTEGDIEWGKWSGTSDTFEKESEVSETFFDQNAYWFVAKPATSFAFPSSGDYQYMHDMTAGDNIRAVQGEYNTHSAAAGLMAFDLTAIDKFEFEFEFEFEFDIDFSNGAVSNGTLQATVNLIACDVLFGGGAGAVSGPYINLSVNSGTLPTSLALQQ